MLWLYSSIGYFAICKEAELEPRIDHESKLLPLTSCLKF